MTPSRLVSLDILRALAIFLVLGRHFVLGSDITDKWYGTLLVVWRRGGWAGVDLFFVLSGFLVSGLLFREYLQYRSISITRFYVRRGLRIYPPFYFFLLICLFWKWSFTGELSAKSVLIEVFFLQSYLRGVWSHTWSLAVEEHFYILLPVLLWMLSRRQRSSNDVFHALPKVTVALGIGLLVIRTINGLTRPYSHQTHTFPTHLRLDALMIGVLLSYFYNFRRKSFLSACAPYRYFLLVLGITAYTLPFMLKLGTNLFMHTIGFTLLSLGGAALLTGLLLSELPNSRLVSILAFIGSCSYSIYLWHIPVQELIVPLSQWSIGIHFPDLARNLSYFFGSLLLGVALSKTLDFPVLAMRDRLFPSRSMLSPT